MISIGSRRETIAAAAAITVSSVLALWPRKALWLDEAQSVAIARSDLRGIVHGLRADGAPPLYYVALHGWMRIFGEGDIAVRSLSALFAISGLIVLCVAATRIVDEQTGLVVLIIAGLNPYFVRYASETRMYSLVLLEVAVGVVALEHFLRTGRRASLAGFWVASTALLYTHYWGLYMIAAAFCCLVVARIRTETEPGRRRIALSALALVAAAVAFAPWIPVLRFQTTHTGTPWTKPSSLTEALNITLHRATGTSVAAIALSYVLAIALVAGLVHRRRGPGSTGSGLSAASLGVALLVIFVVAFVGSRASHSAFVARYTMIMFVPAMIVTAASVARLRRPLGPALVAVIALLGLTVSVSQVGDARTRAPMFEQALIRNARSNDVVVYCPDQLGPPIQRLLDRDATTHLTEWVYPTMLSPERVDWIDYRDRYLSAAPAEFARRAVAAAGASRSVWLVVSTTYPPTQAACSSLQVALGGLRTATAVVAEDPGWRDHDALWRFPPPR